MNKMEISLTEEELIKKHKQERKVLQAQIQSLKKSVAKGDKKRRKEVIEETDQLQQELDLKHASELAAFLKPNNSIEEKTNDISIDELEDIDDVPVTRVSRASKRRQKKVQEERERDKRILEQAEKNKDGPRVLEMNAIKETLGKLGLQLYNIPADGNCLYCAVNHQLEIVGQETYSVLQLRKLTADFMRTHKEDFLPFMYNEDEIVSEDYFESYCKEVATTKLWGGQLELKALSNIVKCPIKVIQANGPPTLQGENFEGPELILAYHRHLYRLGEHYNSTVIFNDSEEDK